MDLNQLKKIIEKVKTTVVIVENGEPILIVSPFEEQQQQLSLDSSSFVKNDRVEEISKKEEEIIKQSPKIIQNTDLLTREEMPADELTIEDLPF